MTCKHDRRKAVWSNLTMSGYPVRGGKQLRAQCIDCGALSSQFLARRYAKPDTPDVDADLLRKHLEANDKAYHEERRQRLADLQKQQREQEQEQRERYREYLQSPAWEAKRKLVLARADNRCEGCLERKATQVHHLTYKHIGNEFLWQLVAICRDCHERFHAEPNDE